MKIIIIEIRFEFIAFMMIVCSSLFSLMVAEKVSHGS